MRRVAMAACAALVLAACGDDDGADVDPVAAAQARVDEAEDELAEAQDAFDDASDTFCEDGTDYVESVDRYGRLFSEGEATVGDVTTAGAAINAFGYLIPGEVKVFDLVDEADAAAWVTA